MSGVCHSFAELIERSKGAEVKSRLVVAAAGDEHTLDAVVRARREGISEPVLVGDKKIIDTVLSELGETIPEENIYDVPDITEAAEKAVSLVREGRGDFLMKGKMDTAVILRAVVNKEHGLGKGGVMSHFSAFEVPG